MTKKGFLLDRETTRQIEHELWKMRNEKQKTPRPNLSVWRGDFIFFARGRTARVDIVTSCFKHSSR